MRVYDYEDLPPGWQEPLPPPPVDPNAVQIPPPSTPEALTKGVKRFRPQSSTQGPSTQVVKARKLEKQSHAPAIVVQHKLAKQGDLQKPMDEMRVAIRRRHANEDGSGDGRELHDGSSHASDSEVEHQLFLTDTSRETTPQPPFQTPEPPRTELKLSDLQISRQADMGVTVPVDSSPTRDSAKKTVRFQIPENRALQVQNWPSGSMVRANEGINYPSLTALQHPTLGVTKLRASTPSHIPEGDSNMDETLRGGQIHPVDGGRPRQEEHGGHAEESVFVPEITPPPLVIPPVALPTYPPFHLASYGYQPIYAAAYQQPQAQEYQQQQTPQHQQLQVPQYQQPQALHYQQPQGLQYQQPQAVQYVYPGQQPWSGPWNGPWNGQIPTNQPPTQYSYPTLPGVAATDYTPRATEMGQHGVAPQVTFMHLPGAVPASTGETTQPQTGPTPVHPGYHYQIGGQERTTPMEVDDVAAGREAQTASEGETAIRSEPEERASNGAATPTETESESEGGAEFQTQSDAATDMETDTDTETETNTNAEAGVETKVKAHAQMRQEQEQKKQKQVQEQDVEPELAQGVAGCVRKEELCEGDPVAGPSKLHPTFHEIRENETTSPEPPSPTSAQRTTRRQEKAPANVLRSGDHPMNDPSHPAETRTFQMHLLEKLSALPSISRHLEDLKARADTSEDVQEEILNIMGKVDQRVTTLEQMHNMWTPLARKRQAERTRRQTTSEMLRNLSSPTAGTDADDEEETDGQGEASRRGGRRIGDPGISRSAKNLIVSDLRKHVKSMLKVNHLRELPAKFPPLTQEEIEAYDTKQEGAPQTSSLNLRIDFESPWKNFAFNEDARGAIITDFNNVLQEGSLPNLAPYLNAITPEVIGVLLDTYVVYLRDQYRLYQNQNHHAIKEERNRKARLSGRRMTLYLSRLRAASIRPHLKHISDLLLNMDASNMSEDERVEPLHAPIYECYYPEWQSEQLRTCFEALDELYREDWAAGNKAGNPPRTRYPNEDGTTISTPAPKGLPRNCYNPAWLATLSDYRVGQYNIQDVDIDLSVAD